MYFIPRDGIDLPLLKRWHIRAKSYIVALQLIKSCTVDVE